MKFSRLYKESKLFWPTEIPIDDGELLKGDGGYFPTLSKILRKTEESQNKINNWHQLMSWAIFCGFHKKAVTHLKNGNLSPVKFSELDQSYVESKVSESLRTVYPSWPRHMKAQYVNNAKS